MRRFFTLPAARWYPVKTLLAVAVVIALGSVGWTLGGEYAGIDPEMGQRLGALAGVVFGLLIFSAMRTQS
jgi:hypothetical protein